MTIKTLLTSTLLATTLLLFTACESKTTTETTGETSVEDGSATGGTTTGGTTEEGGSTGGTIGEETNTTGGSNDDNTTTSGGGANDNTTTNPTPAITLTSLKLTINKTSLNKDESTAVKVMGSYSDGSTKDVATGIEYIITPSDSIEVNGTVLTAKKDGDVTVQAKVGTTLSNTLTLPITWVVNDHVLPPEPDKALNDSTLLGIDTNNNGVRDDVERWIYEEYKDKHPIHIDIGMQAGRAYMLVLETPERAKEIHDEVNAPIACNWYYKEEAEDFNDTNLVNEDIVSKVFIEIYNTEERMNTHKKYDKLLSGATYTTPWPDEMRALCNFNTTQYKK